MGAPINSFEITESIRFFAQLVATEGISDTAKAKVNTYIERLVDVLESNVQQTIATACGLTIVK